MSSARPLISTVIPVFNGAPYIEKAVRSVLEQTTADLECVVVDDGSTDDTPDVLVGLGADVRIVRKENGGVSSARNAGLAAARGRYVAFLDADDCWLPHKLERQLEGLAAHPEAGLIYTGYWIVDEDLRPRWAIESSPWSERISACVHQEGFGIGFSFTAMLPREVIDAVGPFDEAMSASADLDYTWRVARRHPVVGMREPLALYRQHGRSQMHQDLEAIESDMDRIIDGFQAGDAANARRARANVQSFLAMHRLLRGDVGAAARCASGGLQASPYRFLRRPFVVAVRHAQLRLLGRWPYRRRSDPTVLD